MGSVSGAPVSLVLLIECLLIEAKVNLSEKVPMEYFFSIFGESSTEKIDALRVAELEGQLLGRRGRVAVERVGLRAGKSFLGHFLLVFRDHYYTI